MKTASVTEVKNRLSALLELVKHGETVLIMDRGRPVARLEPIRGSTAGHEEAWIAELERVGIVSRPKAPVSRELLKAPPPSLPKGLSALQALLDEREQNP